MAVNQELFTKTALTLSDVGKSKVADPVEINKSLESLAAYRSSSIVPVNLAAVFAPGKKQAVTAEELAQIPKLDGTVYKGFLVNVMTKPMKEPSGPAGVNVEGDVYSLLFYSSRGDAFFAPQPTLTARDRISGIILVADSQTLDGFQWKNVVFANAHIVYLGGPVSLDNVAFVNCTFEVAPIRGTPVLNYALHGQGRVELSGL